MAVDAVTEGATEGGDGRAAHPPGTPRPGRRPRLHYELLVCGLRGHSLVGRDVATITPEDAALVRVCAAGARWHRCLRCDAWVVLPTPSAPARDRVPPREAIALPLRGRPLRDRVVLRLIALDRVVHVVVLGLLAAGVFVFLADRAAWRGPFLGVLDVLAGPIGPLGVRPDGALGGGLVGDLRRAFDAPTRALALLGAALVGYALLEGVEAVGLWWARRWAEYLTFVATAVLLVPELYELARGATPLRGVTLVVNLAVVVYLLLAKRLFGLRGGGRAEAREHERDSGWSAVDRASPPTPPTPPTSPVAT